VYPQPGKIDWYSLKEEETTYEKVPGPITTKKTESRDFT
jgi:hypothetical protein